MKKVVCWERCKKCGRLKSITKLISGICYNCREEELKEEKRNDIPLCT